MGKKIRTIGPIGTRTRLVAAAGLLYLALFDGTRWGFEVRRRGRPRRLARSGVCVRPRGAPLRAWPRPLHRPSRDDRQLPAHCGARGQSVHGGWGRALLRARRCSSPPGAASRAAKRRWSRTRSFGGTTRSVARSSPRSTRLRRASRRGAQTAASSQKLREVDFKMSAGAIQTAFENPRRPRCRATRRIDASGLGVAGSGDVAVGRTRLPLGRTTSQRPPNSRTFWQRTWPTGSCS
jgi:hypothetical protein